MVEAAACRAGVVEDEDTGAFERVEVEVTTEAEEIKVEVETTELEVELDIEEETLEIMLDEAEETVLVEREGSADEPDDPDDPEDPEDPRLLDAEEAVDDDAAVVGDPTTAPCPPTVAAAWQLLEAPAA